MTVTRGAVVWPLAICLVALAILAPTTGEAQVNEAERTAAARALFGEGMEHVDAGQWEEAADLLGRSLQLRSSPIVAYNFALALIELERFVEASEHLRSVEREASEGSDVRTMAAQRLAAILPRLGRLRIEVNGPREALEVSVDGRPVPEPLLGVSQPADPGLRRVSASRTVHGELEALGDEDVRVTSGELATVRLTIPPLPAAPVAGRDPFDSRLDRDDEGDDAWLWVLVASVVVLAGVALGIGLGVGLAQPPEYIAGSSGAVHPTLLEAR